LWLFVDEIKGMDNADIFNGNRWLSRQDVLLFAKTDVNYFFLKDFGTKGGEKVLAVQFIL